MPKSRLPFIFKNLPLLILFYHVQALEFEPPPDDTMFKEPFMLSWTTNQSDPSNIGIIAVYSGDTPATLRPNVQTSLRQITVSIPRRPALPPGPYTLRAVDVSDNQRIFAESPVFFVSTSTSTTSPSTFPSTSPSTTHKSMIPQHPSTLVSLTISTETVISTTTLVSNEPTLYLTSSSSNFPFSTDVPKTLASNSKPTGAIFGGVFGSLGALFLLVTAILLYRRWRRNRRVHRHLANSGEKLSPNTPDWPTQTPRTMEDGQPNETSGPNRLSAVLDLRRRSEVWSTTSERTSIAQERRRRDILSEIWTAFQTEASPRAL